MEHITIGEFERKVRNVFVRMADHHEPISVAMDKNREVILVEGRAYRSLLETSYLLSSSANAERLRKGMRQHKEGMLKSIDVEAYLD